MNKKNLMLIGAHADDVEFNFGGSALKYREEFGYETVYVQSTNNMSGSWSKIIDGESKSLEVPWYEMMPQRKLEAANAARELFGTEPVHLNHPQRHYTDGNLKKVEVRYGSPLPDCVHENTPTIVTAHEDKVSVSKLAKLILEKNPEVIMTHSIADLNVCEHATTAMLVRKAFLEAEKSGYDGSLLFCLTVTSGSFGKFFDMWDVFVDISGYQDRKRAGIGIHKCQVPFPERLDLEDCMRGRKCGVEAAEAFTIFRLSATRQGKLTDELRKNHRYCIEHWAEMFFGK